jgi:hypothetical protein
MNMQYNLWDIHTKSVNTVSSVENPGLKVRSSGMIECHIVYISTAPDLQIRIHHCV